MRHRKPDVPPDDELDQLIHGVGMVCIAASGLEWALTFLMGEVENWGDEKMRTVLARLNREKAPAQQFRKLARRLEAFGLGPDVIRLADDASLLLEERHRVVHSVMMIETRAADEPLYEAWHAKSDTMWPVDPSRLHDLADRITQCTAEVTGLTHAWEERAERDLRRFRRSRGTELVTSRIQLSRIAPQPAAASEGSGVVRRRGGSP